MPNQRKRKQSEIFINTKNKFVLRMEVSVKKIAIITGASSGIGREFALYIDKMLNSVDELWLIARRKNRLEELRENINKPCMVIDEDITDSGFAMRFEKMLKQENPGVRLLINCAGYGIVGSTIGMVKDVAIGMTDTNCLGLTSVTCLVLPYMIRNSRIINMASSAAFLPQPGFAIYAATKSYVLSFSRALNVELQDRGITVTAVCPGPVDTEFFNIAEDGHKRAWFKDLFMVNAADVAAKAMTDSINRKEMSIYGLPMKLFYVFAKAVPHRFILKIYGKFSKNIWK